MIFKVGMTGRGLGSGERVSIVSVTPTHVAILYPDNSQTLCWHRHAESSYDWDSEERFETLADATDAPRRPTAAPNSSMKPSQAFKAMTGRAISLPSDSAERKALPVFSGVVKYFPLALAAVSVVSKKGNDQHNPGQPLHWARGKSQDQLDALTRHVLDVAILDEAGDDACEELAQVAWRALAELQLRLEKKGGLK